VTTRHKLKRIIKADNFLELGTNDLDVKKVVVYENKILELRKCLKDIISNHQEFWDHLIPKGISRYFINSL